MAESKSTRGCRANRKLFFAETLLVILGLQASAVRAAAQSHPTAQPDLRTYVGTWKADFHGKVFAILVLREDDRGALEGTLNNFEIAADKEGNLIDGTHIDFGASPIISPRFKNGALIFTVAQKDAYSQTTDWSFAVKKKGEGELTEILDNQIEVPASTVIKPIPMFRRSR